MKKFVAILLVLVMCAVLVSCGDLEQKGTSAPSGEFSAADIYLTVGGDKYNVDVFIDKVQTGLGDEFEYSEAISCAYDGLDKTYDYKERGLTFYTRPDGTRDMVCEVYATDATAQSSRGVSVGATRDEVKEAYGEPTRSTLILDYYDLPAANAESDGASLYFEYDDDGRVCAIAITAEQLIGE